MTRIFSYILLTILCALPAQAFEVQHAVTITYNDLSAERVQVAGEFSNWERRPLLKRADGTWYRNFYLAPGNYAYKIVLGEEEYIFDPENVAKTENGENSLITVTEHGYTPPNLIWQVFSYTNGNASAVSVAGTFNDWKDNINNLTKHGDVWSARIPIPPGDHEYKFVVDGQWIHDPGNPLRSENFTGTENSLVIVFPSTAFRAPKPRPVKLGTFDLLPNTLTRLSVPVSAKAWDAANKLAKLARETKSNFPTGATMDAALLLPPDFDPRKPWPILVVNGPDGWPNIEHMYQCFTIATEAGYVVLAADGLGSRWAQVGSVLEYLHLHWPTSRQWPVAFAGYTDGSKTSSSVAAQAMKVGYKVIGIWLGSCNEDLVSPGLKTFKPSPIKFRNVPIYIASGSTDSTATPEQSEQVKTSLDKNGFKRVRLDTHDGGQFPVPQALVKTGLQWFLQQAGITR